MMRSTAVRRVCYLTSRSLSTTPYKPTLTEARPGEAGTGGRSSEASLKVALFGASGFVGNYVCGELGKFTSPCYLVVMTIYDKRVESRRKAR